MANILPRDRQLAVISALSEGMSIRSVERLIGIHRDTIMRLGARVGRDCAVLHDVMMRDLPISLIELDELWSYVGKKQRRVLPTDGSEVGDQYVFIAFDATNKAIVSYQVGKRNAENTDRFAFDLRARVTGTPQISSDAWPAYIPAIGRAFRGKIGADYGQIIKSYQGEPAKDAARRYSPGWVVDVEKRVVFGSPTKRLICTSHVERNNLNVRMDCRRFTRLTNGYSKKPANHEAAIALFVAVYNFCRVHSAIRETPAMAIGLTDHPWSIAELIDVAASTEPQEPEPQPVHVAPIAPASVRGRPQFRVIQGGLP
jgi:IS1 family transposase